MNAAARLLVLLLVIAASAAAGWLLRAPSARVGVALPVAAAPELRQVTHERVPAAPLRVYRAEAKRRLGLPPAVQANPGLHVANATKIAADDHPHTISTLVDSATGEFSAYDTRDPLPWLAPDPRGEAGVAYGLRNGQPDLRLTLRQNLFAVKALHVAIEASVDQPLAAPVSPDYFVGLGVSYHW